MAVDEHAASSTKRLSYVPYQRKAAHQRNGSSISHTTAFAPESEPQPLSRSASSASALYSQKAGTSGTSSTETRVGTSSPAIRSHASSTDAQLRSPAASTPLRPINSSSQLPSSLRRPQIASPLSRTAGLVRSHRDLDAPPPPLRVASRLASSTPQSPTQRTSNSQPATTPNRAQTSSTSGSLGSSLASRSSRSQSNASTSTVRADTPSRSPQKLPETPRTTSRVQNSAVSKIHDQNSSQDPATKGSNANGGTPVASSAASSLPGSSRASSAVASPLSSRSSTPIIGASGTSIPAHVNSYAALLAAQSRLGPIPVPQGVALAQAAGSSSASAGHAPTLASVDGRTTAYRSGFQPKGVLRVRTAEFAELRRKRRSEGEMEEQRMDRRLAKLIAIHFSPSGDAEKSALSPAKKSFGSSLIDLDLDELKRDPSSVIRKGGSELWTSFRARGRGEDPAVRQAEQSIVNWQDDAEAKACPICSTPFSFTVRKHHCRLCGRVVCASPHLTRLAWAEQIGPGTGKTLTAEERAALDNKCSGKIVADPISGRIEEVREGSATASNPSGSNAAQSKGVRICRDCKSIVRKRQYMMDDEPLPVFMKLYEALMRVQKEIEQSLPEFQEMVLGLQKQDQTAALGSSIRANLELQRDAVQARKQLLANFATYDELAKRIRALPTGSEKSTTAVSGGGGGGGSDAAQERIQHAIFTRANLFLQQNMLPLQSLPKLGSKKANQGDGGSDSTSSTPGSPRLTPRRGGGGQHANKGSVSSLASFRSLFGGGATRMAMETGLNEQLNDHDGLDDDLVNADPVELKEQLKVLLEQEKLVADYVESAAKARKFEDAKTLKKSHEDLCKEILRIQRRLVVAGQGR